MPIFGKSPVLDFLCKKTDQLHWIKKKLYSLMTMQLWNKKGISKSFGLWNSPFNDVYSSRGFSISFLPNYLLQLHLERSKVQGLFFVSFVFGGICWESDKEALKLCVVSKRRIKENDCDSLARTGKYFHCVSLCHPHKHRMKTASLGATEEMAMEGSVTKSANILLKHSKRGYPEKSVQRKRWESTWKHHWCIVSV